jgi:RimJ/RimL family protein N-acetyltransferase
MRVVSSQVVTDASVYLRPLEAGDIERILKWHNDPALYDHLVGAYRPVTRASVETWLAQRRAAENEVNRAICLCESDEHIGNIYLRDIDRVSGRAELHIFIGDTAHRSKGYGSAAVRQLVNHAFKELRLQRVFLLVLADNERAIRVYEQCGFEREGRLRRHVLKNGQFHDVLVMAVLRPPDSSVPASHGFRETFLRGCP